MIAARLRSNDDGARAQDTAFGANGTSDAQMAEQLKITAKEQLLVARDIIDRLPAVMPLRQVLARELHLAAQRLDQLAAEVPVSKQDWRRSRGRLQTATRELQRLATIAEGARSSLGTAALAPVVLQEPRDKTEAYALLGINPDVSEHIMKKLVEALRQSWHPDHARDEPDRLRREDRIKQINIAWDLIQGKRVEA